MKNLTLNAVILGAVALAGCVDDQPTGPLGGEVLGESFALAGQLAVARDGSTTVRLVNVAASCSSSPASEDGYIELDLRVPDDLGTGSYAVGDRGVGVGLTLVRMPAGRPQQHTVVVGEGTLWLTERTGTTLQGALRVGGSDVELQGAFAATLCEK